MVPVNVKQEPIPHIPPEIEVQRHELPQRTIGRRATVDCRRHFEEDNIRVNPVRLRQSNRERKFTVKCAVCSRTQTISVQYQLPSEIFADHVCSIACLNLGVK